QSKAAEQGGRSLAQGRKSPFGGTSPCAKRLDRNGPVTEVWSLASATPKLYISLTDATYTLTY
ncbi:hypothetical protein, partial [Cereibacter azotoformans]|uniref:hypothetical protein n=1 Tax=Cereibacter azotoformans TaxID=43057 RepID=UPI001958E32B